MKLWFLEPLDCSAVNERGNNPWDPWYDKAFGFVVRAEDELEARKLAAEHAGDEAPSTWFASDSDFNPWLDSNYSRCLELTGEGEAGVILRDFAAA